MKKGNTQEPSNSLEKIQHTTDQNGREHFDDSATKQGRKKLGKRTVGKPVETKHMTPKEFRAYSANIWNGIEMRSGAHNWEAFNFYTLEGKQKRTSHERRKTVKPVETEKRINIRRIEDIQQKNDTLAFYTCFAIALFLLIFWGVAVILKGGFLGSIS